MKVILLQDVKSQGKKGDLINASDGYAINYLLPKKLAIEANGSNMNLFNQKKQAAVNKKDKEVLNAKELAQKLSQTIVILKAKAGENGKLFGSITSKDIAEGLKKQHGVDLDKRKIILNDTLKNIGSSEFEVKVYEGITAKLKVKVESE